MIMPIDLSSALPIDLLALTAAGLSGMFGSVHCLAMCGGLATGLGSASGAMKPGWHALRVEYTDRDPYARLIMTWRPPGDEGFSTIPDAVLLPALHFP